MIIDNDLLSIQYARIMAENAMEAQKKLATFSQEELDIIVEATVTAAEQYIHCLAVMSHEETYAGNCQDKLTKNQFVCSQVRSQLRSMRCVGIIDENPTERITDIGVPVGVIVALCPMTSPVSTTIYKTLIALKSGNAILFSPHPSATKSIIRVLDIMIEAAQASGLPEGCLGYLSPVSKSGTRELMNHPATSLVMVTGVPGMLDVARASGKPVIYGGTGNGPAFIERTANIEQAIKDIIASKTFDNGNAPSAEQSIVADACIADKVRETLHAHNAYFMTEEESNRLAALFFSPDGQRKKGMVGLSIEELARRARLPLPKNTSVLIAERKYVSENDPYCKEILAPVLALYVEADWLHACEKCIELLLHERNSHTLVIHSEDKEVIQQFALKKPVGRLLVNTPASFGGMGATTNLFPSMTLGSGSTGRGITSDNVSPMNLIYIRKVGYGVRQLESLAVRRINKTTSPIGSMDLSETFDSKKVQALQNILAKAINALNDPADK
ncbi:aldehyde dehydrogenase family protein [Desulforhopalus sp. IMCC35007]|uniref:aldehyde dehydrogenase family protein n=1 Tax=Desulforhopalus sp. IMCC35007 TaxID=2569543 RepID=UPI0010AE0EF4|nr:aldehyde dehydrogenase family protein [Desulforhopalus sp. IMCC35007]TKB09582.1 aldehyde dehydrogenase family protein [Desulforhopalus sp. IMCC35007]